MAWIIYGALAYAVYKLATSPPAAAKKSGKAKKGKKPRREGDPHQILGLSPDAGEAEIRRAYQEQVRIYHPDRVASAAPELQRLAEQRTKQINAAYAELMGRSPRSQRDRNLP